jgi:hypothetical protein
MSVPTVNIAGKDMTPSQIIDLLWRYKRALEGLTPGGSEFVNDPEFCAQWARKARDTQHAMIIKQQVELKQLRESAR